MEFDADSTVRLTYERKDIDMDIDQITTTSIALIFHLNPDTIWLQDTIGTRIYIPNDDGSFQLGSSSIAYGCKVNGIPINASQPMATETPPSTSHTIVSPTVGRSAERPFFHSVSSRNTKAKVKIVRARLSYAQNGRPVFQNIDVIFVDVTEENADARSIIRAVQEQFGANYTIVSNNGLEIKDGPGTRGSYMN